MAAYPDRTEMLKYIASHFGIKMSGHRHPGVQRIEQLEDVVPYLENLTPLAPRPLRQPRSAV